MQCAIAVRTVPDMTTATAFRDRQRDTVRRRVGRFAAGIAAIAAFGFADSTATADVASACDAVTIPSLDLSRCVTDGGQDVIDAGGVARYTALSSETLHWLAGHRTSHGGTFRSLTNVRIGAVVYFRERAYVITEYELVNRNQPDAIMPWLSSATPSVVLQTSASGSLVHVWRAVEPVPPTPMVATAPPPVPVP